MKNTVKWITAAILLLAMFFLPGSGTASFAAEDPMIIVSMGDSYSSGEGITPYYGQDKPFEEKIQDLDWLARRSQAGWPALLEVPGYPGTMADYRQTGKSNASCQWYFVAAGGATTSDIYLTEKSVSAYKAVPGNSGETYRSYSTKLPTQISIFDEIDGDVDYVTITIGGNDTNPYGLIKSFMTTSSYLGDMPIDKKMEGMWGELETLKERLKTVYTKISEAAGPQAAILVVGYPALLDANSNKAFYRAQDAEALNRNVSRLNDEISGVVDACRKEGMNIYFVSVENAFDADGGHLAFSKTPWISGVIGGGWTEDLYDNSFISGSSIHPNALGAKAYADCVNAKIRELEAAKEKTTLTVKARNLFDRTKGVSFADITVSDESGKTVITDKADKDGNFSCTIKEGKYKVVVSASGYANFSSNVTMVKNRETVVEALLFMQGQISKTGMLKGAVLDAVSETGVSGASLKIRAGWNNTKGTVSASATTDKNGNYSFNLSEGKYCITVTKSGYATKTVNVTIEAKVIGKQDIFIESRNSANDFEFDITDEFLTDESDITAEDVSGADSETGLEGDVELGTEVESEEDEAQEPEKEEYE